MLFDSAIIKWGSGTIKNHRLIFIEVLWKDELKILNLAHVISRGEV